MAAADLVLHLAAPLAALMKHVDGTSWSQQLQSSSSTLP
jgi:hypothetical protein